MFNLCVVIKYLDKITQMRFIHMIEGIFYLFSFYLFNFNEFILALSDTSRPY